MRLGIVVEVENDSATKDVLESIVAACARELKTTKGINFTAFMEPGSALADAIEKNEKLRRRIGGLMSYADFAFTYDSTHAFCRVCGAKSPRKTRVLNRAHEAGCGLAVALKGEGR